MLKKYGAAGGSAQLHSKNLGRVVEFVVSHQALERKVSLVLYLLRTLVLPAPEHYRPLLRRLAALGVFCPVHFCVMMSNQHVNQSYYQS